MVFTFRSYRVKGREICKSQRTHYAISHTKGAREVTYLDVDFVTAQYNRDILTDALKITMPVGHVLVRDPRGHVEHDDTALALDVVTIAETTEFFLPSSVPNIEADGTEVGGERKGVDLNTEGGCVMNKGHQHMRLQYANNAHLVSFHDV